MVWKSEFPLRLLDLLGLSNALGRQIIHDIEDFESSGFRTNVGGNVNVSCQNCEDLWVFAIKKIHV